MSGVWVERRARVELRIHGFWKTETPSQKPAKLTDLGSKFSVLLRVRYWHRSHQLWVYRFMIYATKRRIEQRQIDILQYWHSHFLAPPFLSYLFLCSNSLFNCSGWWNLNTSHSQTSSRIWFSFRLHSFQLALPSYLLPFALDSITSFFYSFRNDAFWVLITI